MKNAKLPNRRQALQVTAGSALAANAVGSAVASSNVPVSKSYRFVQPDSLCVGAEWESLNPGYWQIKANKLRRRLVNVGDRARSTGFPFHYANNQKKMATEYDPSLPVGILYRRDWKLSNSYQLRGKFTFKGERPSVLEADDPSWKMYQDGYGFMGLALGAKSLFESYKRIRHAIQIGWSDDGKFQILLPSGLAKRMGRNSQKLKMDVGQLKRGDQIDLRVSVEPQAGKAKVTARLTVNSNVSELEITLPTNAVQGFAGVAGRGLIDFEMESLSIEGNADDQLQAKNVECYACYPLGDSLKQQGDDWTVKFVSLFDTDGEKAELRISDQVNPAGGWQSVTVAGTAKIVNHSWRRNTAVIHATLPFNPAEKTLYYTVWKDGQNVTSDPRIGSDAAGPGTGIVGDVPASGEYVGRLPQLVAPYKVCGLSCHAITSGLQQRTDSGLKLLGGGDDWQFRDQPSVESYKHLEDYNFQVMLWEDDVWYMELVFYPPSTDDAYKVVKNSICGPTSRWQLMRHWNVINPGDHDYGMDDVKGPEQIAIRKLDGLGQDASYMRRNFQIVHHLVTGAEEVDPLENPKKWRAWKMPNRDFTLVVLDSRLWRSSQDTDIWDDEGWGDIKNIYDRTDPTRSLLGEEQFAWLQSLVATDSSPLICLTGINGMHTIWAGVNYKGGGSDKIKGPFDQRDRVTADYAGWVKAGADRVLEVLGSREGVVSVYGDVHNGCIMQNKLHGVIECSFGPIGRSGGRALIPGFGRQMKDFDGRDVEVFSLYHKTFSNPDQGKHAAGEPFYWNFLELEFDPKINRGAEPAIGARVRNLIDAPGVTPRGGGQLSKLASQTGRQKGSKLEFPSLLADADVQIRTVEGRPLRATRSNAAGQTRSVRLVGIDAGSSVLVTAFNGQEIRSLVLKTS